MEFRGIGRGSSDCRMMLLSGLTINILLGKFSCQSIFMTDWFKLDVNLPLAERIRSRETNTESSIQMIPWVFKPGREVSGIGGWFVISFIEVKYWHWGIQIPYWRVRHAVVRSDSTSMSLQTKFK